MFYISNTEFRVEDLSTNSFDIMDDKGPEMEDIVPADVIPHL